MLLLVMRDYLSLAGISSLIFAPSETPVRHIKFLPCCMECRRGLAMRILSVCLSVIRVHCDKTEESIKGYTKSRKLTLDEPSRFTVHFPMVSESALGFVTLGPFHHAKICLSLFVYILCVFVFILHMCCIIVRKVGWT